MLYKVLVAAVLLSVVLDAVPLPHTEEGATDIPSLGSWSYQIDLRTRAHVTYIVRSDGPVDIHVYDQSEFELMGNGSVPAIPSGPTGSTLFHRTDNLAGGTYYLVIANPGDKDVHVEYQVFFDLVILADLTAKNVMALALALSMVVAALMLIGRPRRP